MTGSGAVALVAVFFVAAAIWTGGIVVVTVATGAARSALEPADSVAFLRSFGRRHGIVGGAALVVAIGTGIALLAQRPWGATSTFAVVLAVVIAAVTGVGIVQARRMTSTRQDALAHPDDPALASAVVRGARTAAWLRAAITVLTAALVIVGAVCAT